MKLKAAFVTDPVTVHLIIHPGANAENLRARFLIPYIHRNVTPGAAQPAYRRNLFDQIPRPCLKAIIPACQRPYRAEIDHIAGVSVIQAPAWEEADLGSIASAKYAKF